MACLMGGLYAIIIYFFEPLGGLEERACHFYSFTEKNRHRTTFSWKYSVIKLVISARFRYLYTDRTFNCTYLSYFTEDRVHLLHKNRLTIRLFKLLFNYS